MTEKLYEPLPNVDAYLERIGITRAQAPTAEFLDELIDSHQHAVPFEDLDVFELHRTPSLGIADLFDKIVTHKRGGYCFELNALFNALLKALGYETQPTMGRVLIRPIPYPHVTHRANIVHIGGARYLADVGFGGPMPSFAPLIEDGATRTERNQTFTLHRADDYWWEVGFTGENHDDWRVLRFCEMPSCEHDFVPLSFFQAQNPESAFRLHRMANIKTVDGANDLRDNVYTEFRSGQKTSREVESAADLDQLLAEKFGIRDWR